MTVVRRSARVWIPLVAGLALVFTLLMLLTGGSEEAADAAGKLEQPDTVQRVAQRVEEIRGLEFKKVPEVKVVSQEELIDEQKKAAEEADPTEERAAEQVTAESEAAFELLKLTGLVPPDFDPNAGGATGGGSELAGAYVFEENAIRLIRETVEGEPELAEATLAHELTHALETQHFGARESTLSQLNEKAYGLLSLGEGSATVVEVQYAKRHLGLDRPLRDFLGRSFSGSDPKIPDVIEDGVAFPYRNGGLFVDSLVRDAGGNSFELVDKAWKRPPESTAEILHPELWRKNVKPEKVDLGGVEGALGDGWDRMGGTDFGEFDTAALLQLGASRGLAREAAEGWNGGGFEVWRKDGTNDDCKPPCREGHAAVLGWRWSSESEAAEQEKWIEPYLQKALRPESGTDGLWKLKGGGYAAFVREGDASGLAFAPDEDLARELAQTAAG